MLNLIEIINKLFLTEGIDSGKVEQAIDSKRRIIMNYEGDPDHGIAPGPRYIDVYSFIKTRAGNPAIRAYQPMGDTASDVPSWKLFRLDRIKSWRETPYINKIPAEGFNRVGDKGAAEVYKIANYDKYAFSGLKYKEPQKEPEIYKTQTEKDLETLKQKIAQAPKIELPKEKPVKAPEIEVPKPEIPQEVPEETPIQQQQPVAQEPIEKEMQEETPETTNNQEPEIYKTETEKNIENLNKQLQNPKYLEDFNRIINRK